MQPKVSDQLSDDRGSGEHTPTDLASIHRVNGGAVGVSTRKVPSELGRWELLKLPRSELRGHLASAIVTRAGQDPCDLR